MRLTDLEARFVTYNVGPSEEHWPKGRPSISYVETLQEAHGVWFLCPKCFAANGGKVGTHMVGCYFVGKVPAWAEPGPGRWNPSGTGLHDLTFVPPGATSVLLTGGCGWHGFVSNGCAE
jgi:hypothetical protein